MCNNCVLVCVGRPRSEDPLEYFNREVQKRRDEETNLWSTPGDPSHSEREDDRVLYGLLQARNKTRMGSSVCEGGFSRHTTESWGLIRQLNLKLKKKQTFPVVENNSRFCYVMQNWLKFSSV